LKQQRPPSFTTDPVSTPPAVNDVSEHVVFVG
jgi:hypothetical protein